MKKTIRAFCNFFVMMTFVIGVTYISFFTDIPTKTGNVIRQKIEEVNNEFQEYNSDFKINSLGINYNTYYFDKLTDEQKNIYASIANAVKNFQQEFVVRNYVAGDKDVFASEVSIAIEAFINDHPEVFYLQSQYSSYVLSAFEGNIGYIKLNYTENNIEEVNNKLSLMEQKIEEYIKELDGLNDFEKELKIHDRLAYAVTYSNLEELPRAYHTAEGTLLENTGVCDGFTKALQIMYNKVGIDSIIVLGTLDGNPHAWNLVKIEDEWYHTDITSSRSIYDETQLVNHAYFNLNDEKIKNICTLDNEEIIPRATSTKYNYYEYNKYIINENENIQQRLTEIYDNFKNEKYIEFYLDRNVSDTISSVLVALKKIDTSFLNGTKMYYYNIQNAIIIPKN